MKKTILLIIAAALLNGCTLLGKAESISNGDSRSTVIAKMGEPDKTEVNGQFEALTYCQNTQVGYNNNVDVILKSDVTVLVHTYQTQAFIKCTFSLEPVDWADITSRYKEQYGNTIQDDKAVCRDFGFKDQTDGMANCLLTQQGRHDAKIIQRNEAAQRKDQATQNAINARMQRESDTLKKSTQPPPKTSFTCNTFAGITTCN